jgi:hypothetical protein
MSVQINKPHTIRLTTEIYRQLVTPLIKPSVIFLMTAWTNVMANESSCTAIQSSTGLGKSTMMRKHAGNFIIELRANGDARSVVVFVPTINLAREQMFKFREQFPTLTAECYIGLDRYNPNKTNIKMCERTEAKSLIEKGIAISNLCGSKQSTEWCSHHINSGCDYPCGYSQQQHIHADIWFMAHQKLFTPKPLNIDPAAVIIDESFWSASISNTIKLRLSNLTNTECGSVYQKACEIILPYLNDAPDGYLDTGFIRSTSSDAIGACFAASKELSSFSRSGIISPSMASYEVEKTLNHLPSKLIITFWRVLAAALVSGIDETPYIVKTTSTNNEYSLFITEKQKIHKDWNTDTLILDATLSTGITRDYFPEVKTQVIDCPMSETTVTQISDMPLSKKMMLPDEKRGAKKYAELIKNLDKLIFILIVRIADITAGVKVDGYSEPVKMLLVTNKAIEEKLVEHKDFPTGIATMHYGATSGIDIYKDVPSLVIVGRMMLPVKEAENLASLLKGEVISVGNSESMYPKRSRTVVTEYSEVCVESDYHTDPLVEAVRYSITESEIIQAIGRGRAIRRDDTNPLEILILTNVPLPEKVDLLTTWKDVVPTKIEALLADTKIVPLSYSELARIYPIQFNSVKVARTDVSNFFSRYKPIQDVVKSNLSAFLPIYSINREKGTQFQHYKELVLVSYTRRLKGAKPCFAVIFDIEANEIEEALAALVGELKSYKYICAFSVDGEALP